MNNVWIGPIDIGNRSDIPQRTIKKIVDSQYIIVESLAEFYYLLEELQLSTKAELIEFNYGISNKQNILNYIVELAKNNKSILITCNSGTPSIFDPGQEIILSLQKENIKVNSIPGPTAVITALVASGFSLENFIYDGMISGSSKEKINKLSKWKDLIPTTLVFFENDYMVMRHTLNDILNVFKEHTNIFIGINLTTEDEFMFYGDITQAIDWCIDLINEGTLHGKRTYITYVLRLEEIL